MNIIAPLSPSRPRVDDALRALIANRVPGHSLDAPFYSASRSSTWTWSDLRPPLDPCRGGA